MTLPFIDDEYVSRNLSYGAVRSELRSAFQALRDGRAAIQPRSRTECGAFRLSTMGAVWVDRGLALVKTYGTVQGRFDFMCQLFDTASGMPVAVMQGNEITRFRTPALTALAIEHAAARTRTLALFGAGAQGQAHAEALLESFDFEEVRVVDLNDVTAWCTSASKRWGRRFIACDARGAVEGADVVVTATRSKQPLFDGAWLSHGALVAAIGTSLPGGSELDDTTLRRASRVFVEWKPQSMVEAGEVRAGLASGALDEQRITDLTELPSIAGRWLSEPSDVVVFKAVGVGLSDIAAASLAWDAWRNR